MVGDAFERLGGLLRVPVAFPGVLLSHCPWAILTFASWLREFCQTEVKRGEGGTLCWRRREPV